MSTSQSPYRADLEALRGLAILLVVAYHAGVPALAGGFVGVDVFFLLAGYFTARLLVQEYGTTGTVDLRAFYARRALRLLPALLVVVTATLVAVWTLWAPIDRPGIAATARAVLLGMPNIAFAREGVNYFAGPRSPFLHSWSLGVELQVSLFAPLLFVALAALGAWRTTSTPVGDAARRISALVRGVPMGLVLTGGLSLGIAIWGTATNPSSAYFGTAARVWEFVAGALLMLMLPSASDDRAGTTRVRDRGWWLQVGGLLAIVIAALLYDRSTPYPGSAALLPVIGAGAVIAGGAHGNGLLGANHWSVRALARLGGLSYSWYLWHWPIVLTVGVLVPTLGMWGRIFWSAAALAPAWLTHHWVERPLREHHGDVATQARWRAAAAVAACLTLALATALLERSAQRTVEGTSQRSFAAARFDRMPHECWAGDGAAVRRVTPSCVFGDPSGTATVALFGDSHAEHWLAALDRLGRERGWRVVPMVKGGCPVADAPELIGSRTDRHGRDCARWREAAIRQLIALRPDVAVLGSFDDYVTRVPEPTADRTPDGVSPAAWRRGLRRTYARLAGAGIPVVAIRGTPRPGFDVPACLSRRAAGLPMAGPCVYERDDALHYGARTAQLSAARDVAARGLPVDAIDLLDQVCPTVRCGVVRDGIVQFTDDNHLTASFTRRAARALGTRLDVALGRMGVRLP